MCLKNMETKLLQIQMECKGSQINVINLDDYQSSQDNLHFSFVNLFNIPTTFISHSIIVPRGSIGVKYKQSNVFSLVLEVTNKKRRSSMMLWNT